MSGKQTKKELAAIADKERHERIQTKITAAVVGNPAQISANVLSTLYKDTLLDSKNDIRGLDLSTLVIHFEQDSEAVKSGDLYQIESILSAQVNLLHHWFCRYLTISFNNQGNVSTDVLMAYYHLALKLQEQTRKTAATLGALKNPKQTTFIKQQNAANQQIVNNQFPEINSQETTNEILEGDASSGERVDTRTEPKAIGANTRVETLAANYGAKDSSREAAFVQKREKTRHEVGSA